MTSGEHPVSRFGPGLTWLVTLIVVLAGMAVLKWHEVVPLCHWYRHQPVPYLAAIDSERYLQLAQGRIAEVESPFSKRVLHPWLVSQLSAVTGMELPQSFLIVNVLAFALLAYCVAELLRHVGADPRWALLLLLTPFALEGLLFGYMSDLFHMALSALFFLLLLRGRIPWALLVLFLAFLARESTLLLCVMCGALAWWRRERKLMLGCIAVLLAGMFCSSLFGRMGQPNIHKLPDLFYLALKVPYNFLSNVCGLVIWSDVRPDVGVPFAKWDLPAWLHIGSDRQVGLCFRGRYPLNTLLVFVTLFGSGLFFLVRTLRALRAKRGTWRGMKPPFAVELAFFYGTIAFLLGTSLGDWVERLIGYGWPVFWIALPYLILRARMRFCKREVVVLAVCHFLICWWPRLVGYERTDLIPVIPVLIPCAATIFLLARARWPKGDDADAAPFAALPGKQ